MNFAFYGRINAGKDTAATMTFIALTFWKLGAKKEALLKQENLESTLRYLDSDFARVNYHSILTKGALLPFKDIMFMSFSTRIHEMTALLTGIPLEQCVDRQYKDTLIPKGFHKTVRLIMIDIGEGLRASYGNDVWVAPVMNTIEKNPRSIILIPGMRHPNEYFALNSLGDTIFIKIKSDFEVVKGTEFAEGLLEDHPFDVVLNNKQGNFKFLWKQVVNMVYSYNDKINSYYAN